MQGERMSNEAPLKPLPGDELAERIRQLAAQGLRVRDISSLLHVHPQIVIRVIEAQSARGVPSDLGAIDSDPAVGRRPLLNP
jgi:hypothetical protein